MPVNALIMPRRPSTRAHKQIDSNETEPITVIDLAAIAVALATNQDLQNESKNPILQQEIKP
jgi:hypothetical protein